MQACCLIKGFSNQPTGLPDRRSGSRSLKRADGSQTGPRRSLGRYTTENGNLYPCQTRLTLQLVGPLVRLQHGLDFSCGEALLEAAL